MHASQNQNLNLNLAASTLIPCFSLMSERVKKNENMDGELRLLLNLNKESPKHSQQAINTFPSFPATIYLQIHLINCNFHTHICSFTAMDHSSNQGLIANGEDENEYYLPDDEYDQEGSLYLLNTIISGTARLNVLLPAATILTFTVFTPIITNDGQCKPFDRLIMIFFLTLSASSCVFLSFTDSFRTANGRLYYGLATFNGILTFCGGCKKRPRVLSDYRLRWADLFYAWLSLIAFLTFAASHNDVLNCFNLVVSRRVVNSVPLVVGFVVSVLFVMFPSRRRGVGYPFLLQTTT